MSVRPITAKNTFRQLKLALPGGAITYYLGTVPEFWQIIRSRDSLQHTAALAALLLGLTTIALFLYILLLPWLKGVEPNYSSWRESSSLSVVIPMLTMTIVVGLLLLAFTLGQWSGLGYAKGTIGAMSIYLLAFGVLGLIPVPKAQRQ